MSPRSPIARSRGATWVPILLRVACLATALGPASAAAGSRPYGFAAGIESLPQGELELENWYTADRRGGATSWDWWVGPVTGMTSGFEVGLFAVLSQPAGSGRGLVLDSLRLQASWLLAPRGAWPVDVSLRLQLGAPVAADVGTLWATAVVSRDLGELNLTANLTTWGELARSGDRYLSANLGASYRVPGGARLGVEGFGDSELGGATEAFIGPALAFGRGRFWSSATAGWGVGAQAGRVRGRLVLAIVL